MLDILIRGGLIVDGSGAPQYSGDVAVKEGTIAAVGKVTAPAHRVIDAEGALVMPGWVDAHTHYDGQVTWDDHLEGSAANGVTTVVMGNCGVGFAPVRPDGAQALIELMEGVEDIPGTALFEGMPWGEWRSFPEYMAFLDQREWSVDVAAQLAHGALRSYVMGDRAVDESANGDDLRQMREIVENSAAAGAVGFSTSRISIHKSRSGDYVPGTFAGEDELRAILTGMRAGGDAILQAIPANTLGHIQGSEPDHSPLLDEVNMLGRLSRELDLRVVFTVFQTANQPGMWRDVLKAVSAKNGQGARLAPMVAPRTATTLTTLRCYHPFMRRPTYLKLAHLPHEKLVAELRNPAVKAAILREADVPHPDKGTMESFQPQFITSVLPLIFKMERPIDYEPRVERSIAALAEKEGRDPLEYLYDYLLEEDGSAVGVHLATNYADGNLDACREMLMDGNTVMGLSDAGAHVNLVSDMSFPTFNLVHWGRDRSRGERLPIELVVEKATSRPAEVFGLTDRGRLEVGKRADINVVDLDALDIKVPEYRRDLPAGGSRFVQPATGYVATLNNGAVAREHDQDTGARPGRVARPQSIN